MSFVKDEGDLNQGRNCDNDYDDQHSNVNENENKDHEMLYMDCNPKASNNLTVYHGNNKISYHYNNAIYSNNPGSSNNENKYYNVDSSTEKIEMDFVDSMHDSNVSYTYHNANYTNNPHSHNNSNKYYNYKEKNKCNTTGNNEATSQANFRKNDVGLNNYDDMIASHIPMKLVHDTKKKHKMKITQKIDNKNDSHEFHNAQTEKYSSDDCKYVSNGTMRKLNVEEKFIENMKQRQQGKLFNCLEERKTLIRELIEMKIIDEETLQNSNFIKDMINNLSQKDFTETQYNYYMKELQQAEKHLKQKNICSSDSEINKICETILLPSCIQTTSPDEYCKESRNRSNILFSLKSTILQMCNVTIPSYVTQIYSTVAGFLNRPRNVADKMKLIKLKTNKKRVSVKKRAVKLLSNSKNYKSQTQIMVQKCIFGGCKNPAIENNRCFQHAVDSKRCYAVSCSKLSEHNNLCDLHANLHITWED